MTGHLVHRVRYIEEVLEELAGDIFVGDVVLGEFERDSHHVEGIGRHPARRVGLIQTPAERQLRSTIERPDVVEPEKTALKDVVAGRILAIDPPGKVHQKFLEDAFEEDVVGAAVHLMLDLEDAIRRPGVHRRVGVAEGPFVGG